MKCPECGTENAQQLLVSFLCPNRKCKNYDSKQELKTFFKKLGQKKPEKIKAEADSHLEMLQQILVLNRPKEEDSFDVAIREYLQRKLQINMLKDLGDGESNEK